ncbi:MAG: hypothetical protein CME01_07420 [Geminicoccus sp.]|nr:hypothetical protein [Geminicoccus sp.]
MPLDAPRQQLETWEAFFALLPFVRSDHSTGKRHFWTQNSPSQLDATAPCIEGQHEGLQRGCDWAEQTVHALRTSEKRGVLLRILRDMEFESAEAVGFISEIEEWLAQNTG